MVDDGENEDVMPPEESEAVRLFDLGYRVMSVDVPLEDGVERHFVVFHSHNEFVDILIQRADHALELDADSGLDLPVAPDAVGELDQLLLFLDSLTYHLYSGTGTYYCT